MRQILLYIICALTLTGCAQVKNTISKNEVAKEDTIDIFAYQPTFTDIVSENVAGDMTHFTFIHLHSDTDGNWAYVQDFKNGVEESPLYVYEFANTINVDALLNDMPERTDDFKVSEEDKKLVEDFYDHLTPEENGDWRIYKVGDYILKYINTLKGENYYNEKRFYKNGKPSYFITELSDPYRVNDIEVQEDAYVWVAIEGEE